jgi:hypothetical protein
MKKILVCLLLAGGGCCLPVLAAWAAPSLIHQPPLDTQTGAPLDISVLATDPASPIQQVRLYYRPGGTLGFQMQIMNGAGYNYTAQIPASAITAGGVDYYLEARDQLGETATAPPLNAALAPFHLVAREAHGTATLRLISPDNGGTVTPEEAMVVVALAAPGSRVDLKTLKVMVDEQDVTSACRVSETLLTYVLPESSPDGLHGVRVSVRTLDGGEAVSPAWSFTLKRSAPPGGVPAATAAAAAAAGASQLSGTLATDVQYAAMTKDSSTDAFFYQPRGWLNRATLNLNGSLGGLHFLAAGYVTSEETPGRQPVDRLRLELFDDGFNATLGDMYPVFSQYSLNNLFVRGGSLSLMSGTPDAAYSKFQVVGGLTEMPIEGRDTSAPGTYEQVLWGTRWLYNFLPGTGLALNYDTVNDYAGSLQNSGGALPVHNWVATSEATIRIPWQERLATTLFGEGGVSYYDQNSNLLSLALGNAYRGGMRWDWGGRSYASVEYKNTGANYVSAANPWLIGDWQGVAGDSQMYFLDGTLAVMLNGNVWHDNLGGQKNEKFVDAAGVTVNANTGTTTTTFLSGMVNAKLAAFLPAVFIGYSYNGQRDDTAPHPLIDNRTGVVNAGLGAQVPLGGNQGLANVTYSQTQYRDLAVQRLSADMRSTSFFASLMFLLGPAWSFSGGYGMTSNFMENSGFSPPVGSLPTTLAVTADQSVDYTLLNLRANWKALPGKLDLGAGWENLAGKDNLHLVENRLTTVSLQGTWYFTAAQNLGLKFCNAAYDDQIMSANSYTEFITSLHYGITF